MLGTASLAHDSATWSQGGVSCDGANTSSQAGGDGPAGGCARSPAAPGGVPCLSVSCRSLKAFPVNFGKPQKAA